jgi:hypothetical protein
MSFRSEIKSVSLRLKHIIISLENKVYIYELSSIRLLNSLDTLCNPRGLLSVNTNSNAGVIIGYPSDSIGVVGIYDLINEEKI